MIGALKFEVMRIRTIRSSYWMSGIAIGLSLAIAIILALVVAASNSSDLGDLAPAGVFTVWITTAGASAIVMPVLAAVFFAVMGSMAMGHEYRYGTNKATLTAIPDRYAVLAAKVIVLAVWVAISAIIILLLDTLVGWAFVSNFSLDGDSFRPMIDYLGYCVGFAIAGFGLSSIFRNQAGAIVAVLVWPLVIEPIIYNILRAIAQTSNAGIGDLANLLPASSGRRTMFRPYDLFSSLGDSDLTVWGLGASTVVYWAGVAIVAVVGSILFVTRDA